MELERNKLLGCATADSLAAIIFADASGLGLTTTHAQLM